MLTEKNGVDSQGITDEDSTGESRPQMSSDSLPAEQAASLKRALEKSIEGEVRFDKISRALYSTDVSVYQIMPLGVVIPRTPDDVVRTVNLCREHGAPITARGGGTSQAGQAIGPGVQIDFTKYMNRVTDLNVPEMTVRVEPGIILDNLNELLKPHGLQLPLDISSSSRAAIGGMIGNNAAGARSIVYGRTIDYVNELTVVLADGSTVTFRPEESESLTAKCSQTDLEGSCYRIVRRLAAEHTDEIDRRFPKILRRVGGYCLDEFVRTSRPFNLSRRRNLSLCA